ncbi:MAG: S41 family peptidase [Flavobacteriales bacterium]|nr:S41 family peptidase [Flavobacteriales bacterium]
MNNENLDNYRKVELENPETPSSAKAKASQSSLQPLLFAGTLILGMFIGTNLGDHNIFTVQQQPTSESNPNKLVSIIDYIENNYVDSIEKRRLVDDAIVSVLQNLDPHSTYISPEESARVSEQLKGSFEGIGVEFVILRDSLFVVKPIEGGPSIEAGIKEGDRIVKVDGKEISGKDLDAEKVTKLLKGPGGSKVQISVLGRGEEEERNFTIERGDIPIKSVTSWFMVDEEVGYIEVDRFASTTYAEFMKCALELKEKGMKKLILDLRNNGGGLLDQATGIVEEFLSEGKLIVSTKGVHKGTQLYKSSRKGKFRDMEIVVMINQNSASASEIVAGALQDWDRSVTVGRRSFGKGLVQNELDLPDNSALRLTIARYYTPTGRCIQKPYGDSIVYEESFAERFERGELTSADSVLINDSLKYRTPGGRIVYGGGGITPDVFVPLDTSLFSGAVSEVLYSGVLRKFCFDYVDANRRSLEKYADGKAFTLKFSVTDAIYKALLAAAEKEKIKTAELMKPRIREHLQLFVKGEIGRNLFTDNVRQQIVIQQDQDFRKALKVIKDYKEYAQIAVSK